MRNLVEVTLSLLLIFSPFVGALVLAAIVERPNRSRRNHPTNLTRR